jgi:PAS domain S-box-containing protein
LGGAHQPHQEAEMAVQPESSTEEIKRLRRCINDLVSVLALPAMWIGGSPSQIVDNLLDALVTMLNLDFIYARLSDSGGAGFTETVRVGSTWELTLRPHEISEKLQSLLGNELQKQSTVGRTLIGEREIVVVPLQLGLHDEIGVIVAGCQRVDFPRQTERLVLSVAANQAAIGLREASLLRELDQRVAERTSELAAANEELIREIADRKRAEEALLERELNLRQITETIPEMLWSATPEGAIDYCNGRLLAYTGFSAEEIKADGWRKLLHPDDADQAGQVWMRCFRTGAPYRIEVRTIHAGDGSYRWCITNALPLVDAEGRIVKWHGTVVDIHDWKKAQEELRNTQEELARVLRVMTMGQLTASIAHEVNQPLSGIVTNASTCLRMLDANPPNLEGARETARRTIRDGNRASGVITRLRTLYSKKDLVPEPMDLNEATREVISLSLSELQRNRVVLRQELAEDLPLVMGDRIQIQQVILNFIRNGSDAMSTVDDRPRELLIKTETDEGVGVRLSVKDAGVGFDPQTEEKLFEAFYTTKSDGMGIGLSVSHSIIESHQGRLWAARNEGPGATFSFAIPRSTNT